MAGTTITFRTDPDLARKITAIAATMDRSRNWVIQDINDCEKVVQNRR